MARPLSEKKRDDLMAAALAAVASSGVGAPTLRIAKDAGVAEGTLFRYFPTKDDLLNRLYLSLKADLTDHLLLGLPRRGPKAQFEHLWNRFIDWGIHNPDKHKALRQLEVSQRISKVSQDAGDAISRDLQMMVVNGFESGILRPQPILFLWGIIQSIADVVIESATAGTGTVAENRKLGWDALWGAIGQSGS